MLKKLLASILVVFAVILAPAVAQDLAVSNEVNTVATADPGTTVSGSFRLTNTGASTITNIDVSVLNPLSGPAGTIPASAITLNPNLIVSLASGASQTVAFSIAVPQGEDPGLYVGTLEVSDGGANTEIVSLELTVRSRPGIDVLSNSVVISGQEDDSRTQTVQIRNTGNAVLNAVTFIHNINLTDEDGDAITLDFDPQFTSLNPGQEGAVRITADIGQDVDIDSYSGTVTVSSGSVSDTFSLEVRVQPEVCSDGPIGDVRINVQEPDDGDDFAPGDTINIEVEVENTGEDDEDFIVEAFLYNVNEDDTIEEVESDEVGIDEGDEEDVELDLVIPTDPDDINTDDEYVLFIKAYVDGDEDEHCAEERLDIEIERERDDVRINDVTASPSVVACGEFVEFTVDVTNVGSNDQDEVYIELSESELGFDERSEEFDLDDGDSDDDNEATRRFSLQVPRDAEAKTYLVEASVFFDDGDESQSEFVELRVTCGNEPDDDDGPTPPTTSRVDLEVLSSQVSSVGSTFSIPVKITNNGNSQESFTIGLENIQDWASPVSDKVLTLNAGQSSTLYFYVTADEDVTGRQSATITVEDADGAVLDSQTISVELGDVEDSGESFFGGVADFVRDNSTIFWIIGNLVLLVLIILFLKVLFTKKRN